MSGTHITPDISLSLLCEICGKNFTNQSQLRLHTRLHLPIEQRRTFECYVCKSNFAYKKSLIHHMSLHSGKTIQYQCDVCQSTFSRSDALRRHSLIHLGKLPHNCKYCEKGFRTKFNLKVIEIFILKYACRVTSTILNRRFTKESTRGKRLLLFSLSFYFYSDISYRIRLKLKFHSFLALPMRTLPVPFCRWTKLREAPQTEA